MHIPDGYLSPRTCIVFFTGMLPVWYLASKKVQKALKLKSLSYLALGSAFAFVIMMFNIPIPGGSSGHMVGATVAAIALGPWAAVIALTLTLTLQAFFFGDGGLTALGANCFNMAFVMSFAGYYAFRAICAGSPGNARIAAGSAIAAYLAVNIAAFAVAVELGAQPLIAHGADGRPLYAPYPLGVAIPAMMIPHLLLLGPVEALGTAFVVSYLYRHSPELFYDSGRKGQKPLWAALIILIALVPLGLMAEGTPWGEWGMDELSRLLGYIPAGMEKAGQWQGLMPDYSIPGVESGAGRMMSYILAALLASGAFVAVIYLWGRVWRR